MLRRQQRNASAGFTIVELLVVIGIIAILLSLVSISLVQGGQSARQTKALSALKQIGTAWMQYANQSEDRVMPGYMDDGVQAAFKIKVRDGGGQRVDPQYCRTYSFRLLPFLDNDRSLMYDYVPDNEMPSELPPQVISDQPAFGYNAFYVGGWWTSETGAPKMRFSGTGYFGTGGQLVQRQEVVVRALAQVERTSDLIVFSASTAADDRLRASSRPPTVWNTSARSAEDRAMSLLARSDRSGTALSARRTPSEPGTSRRSR